MMQRDRQREGKKERKISSGFVSMAMHILSIRLLLVIIVCLRESLSECKHTLENTSSK